MNKEQRKDLEKLPPLQGPDSDLIGENIAATGAYSWCSWRNMWSPSTWDYPAGWLKTSLMQSFEAVPKNDSVPEPGG